MNTFDIGDTVRMRGVFTNSAGAAVDPSTVTMQYRPFFADPASYNTVIYGPGAIVKGATGDYFLDLDIRSGTGGYSEATMYGKWFYRWNGTGNNAAAAEGMFEVRTRNVGAG